MAITATAETEHFDPLALQQVLDRPYAPVRDQAGVLVDAFGIPDQVLAAPIGLREES